MQPPATIPGTKTLRRTLLICLLLAAVTACGGKKNEYVQPPAPKVTVAQPLQQEVTDYLEFTGTTRAFETVELRARVAGFLNQIHFIPGTVVPENDLLFEIDPREYEARLNAAKAELESARAQMERARIEYDRAKRVFEQGAGAETNVVKWQSELGVTQAAVSQAEARVQRAELDLSFTRVTAPFTGRVSRNRVDAGNLVGAGEPTLLTTIIKYDPMYAYFNLNERDLLKVMKIYRQRVKDKGIDIAEEPENRIDIPLYLQLADEADWPHEGELDFSESGVDPATGTLQLRGVFVNPEHPPKLLPGMFVRIRMPIEQIPNALLVTERALGADQSGSYLLTVNSANEVEKHSVRLGQLVDGLRVILEGIQASDRVIVTGLQRARAGAKVSPEPAEMKSFAASALQAEAAAKKDESANKRNDTAEPKKTEGEQNAPVEKASTTEPAAGSPGTATDSEAAQPVTKP